MKDLGWHTVTTGVALYWIYKLALVALGIVYVVVTQREPVLCLVFGNLAAFTIADVTDAMVMRAKDPKRPPTRLDTVM